MSIPVFDADVLALQGWINRKGIIPPGGQAELRAAVGRVLDKLANQTETITQLLAETDAKESEIQRLWKLRLGILPPRKGMSPMHIQAQGEGE